MRKRSRIAVAICAFVLTFFFLSVIPTYVWRNQILPFEAYCDSQPPVLSFYVITSTESTTINGLSCILGTASGTEVRYGYADIIPNSTYIYLKPYIDCSTTDVLPGTKFFTSWSNSTSGNLTIRVFPTATYTETEYVENYSTTVTLK